MIPFCPPKFMVSSTWISSLPNLYFLCFSISSLFLLIASNLSSFILCVFFALWSLSPIITHLILVWGLTLGLGREPPWGLALALAFAFTFGLEFVFILGLGFPLFLEFWFGLALLFGLAWGYFRSCLSYCPVPVGVGSSTCGFFMLAYGSTCWEGLGTLTVSSGTGLAGMGSIPKGYWAGGGTSPWAITNEKRARSRK